MLDDAGLAADAGDDDGGPNEKGAGEDVLAGAAEGSEGLDVVADVPKEKGAGAGDAAEGFAGSAFADPNLNGAGEDSEAAPAPVDDGGPNEKGCDAEDGGGLDNIFDLPCSDDDLPGAALPNENGVDVDVDADAAMDAGADAGADVAAAAAGFASSAAGLTAPKENGVGFVEDCEFSSCAVLEGKVKETAGSVAEVDAACGAAAGAGAEASALACLFSLLSFSFLSSSSSRLRFAAVSRIRGLIPDGELVPLLGPLALPLRLALGVDDVPARDNRLRLRGVPGPLLLPRAGEDVLCGRDRRGVDDRESGEERRGNELDGW